MDTYTAVPGLAPSEDVIAAEEAILGAAIQSKTAAERMAEIVRPDDFWKTKHQVIAEAIKHAAMDLTPDQRKLGMTYSPLGTLRPPARLTVRGRLARW